MTGEGRWMTPFKKQCFVVVGSSVNMAQIGMVMGFASSLVPQLRTSAIIATDSAGSWVASLPAFGLMVGNITIPSLMVKFGRKKANLISILIIILGWSCLLAADSLAAVLAGRMLQGISAGMSSCLTPTLIGEYTSPKNRGAFSIVMSLIMAVGTFMVHAVGSYASWKVTASICNAIALIDFVMVMFSPEAPSWLADRGQYVDCERAFRWLRGSEEEEELASMIEASKSRHLKETRVNTSSCQSFLSAVVKKEFYMPILIMIHLYIIAQWAGIHLLAAYIVNLVRTLSGSDDHVAVMVMSVDVLRMVSCVLAVFIIRRMKRRTMLFGTIGLNCVILLAIAGYAYAKDMLQFEDSAVGVLLLHLLMVTVAVGSLPLPLTIAGEIFPLRYKGLSSGISTLVSSINTFICLKTFSFLENVIGLHGVFCLYACILVYCLAVVWFLLPETKDRTLQEIEDELKGMVSEYDLKSAQPLTVLREEH